MYNPSLHKTGWLFWLVVLVCLAAWIFLPQPVGVYVCDPGTILVSLAISAAVTAGTTAVDYLIAKNRKVAPVDRGKQDDIRISLPGYGESIIRGWGTFRTAPIWFWNTPIVHSTITTPGRSGGKGAPKPPTPSTVDHIYTTSLAGVICEGPIQDVTRIWFDQDLVWNTVDVSPNRYEAEAATLAGGAASVASTACSGGHRVQGIGSGGSVQFSVTVPATGSYEVGVYYTSTVDRTFKYRINGGSTTDLVCPASGGANIVAIQSFTCTLNSGANTIKFENAGAACPDLDKIEVVEIPVFDDNGGDPRSFTGLIDPNIVPAVDQNHSWTSYMHRPEAASDVISTNLGKYGQPAIRIYLGTETQAADAAIIADKGVANAPAYRGVATIVIEGIQLPGGRIPNVTIEVVQGTTDVDTIVSDIYDLVNVDSSNLDVTAVSSDTLIGFLIPSRKGAADAIAELQTRFQFDLPEVDGKVKAVKRNGTSDLTIPSAELRAHLYGEEMPAFDALITDIDPLLLPGRVDVNYLDPALDYHNNTQSDMRLVGPQGDNQTVSLSIVDSEDNMKQLASVLLYKPDREGRDFKIVTGPKYQRAHVGTVITLTLANATHVMRVTNAKYSLPAGPCEFDGVRQQASLYSPTGTGSAGTGFEAPIAPIPANTKGVIIDGPLFRAEDGGDGNDPVVYVTMCGRGSGVWPGGFWYEEFPIGSDNYRFVTAADKPSAIGVAAGTLATVSDPSVWDRTSSLVIKFFSNTELSSATEQDVLANPALNLLAIINPSTNEVEMIQFATAVAGVAIAPYITQYTVSIFLRGRFATDGNVSTHTAADDVVVIDSNVKPRRMSIADVGRNLKFKFVSSGQAVDDAATVIQTLHGNSLRPLAPVNVTGVRDGDNNLLIQWTRRSRIAPGLRPGSDVPRGEESEIYSLEVYNGSTLLRTIPVIVGLTQPTLLLPGNFAADISGNNMASSAATTAYALIAQRIVQLPFFVEGTANVPVGGGNTAGIRFAVIGGDPTNSGNVPIQLSVTNSSFLVVEYGVVKASFVPSTDGSRWRVEFDLPAVKIYENYVNSGSIPVYESVAALTAPCQGIVTAASSGELNDIVISTTVPGTVLSADLQTELGFTPGDPIKVRVRQMSSVVGPGYYTEVTL